jgi:hypothetical protein
MTRVLGPLLIGLAFTAVAFVRGLTRRRGPGAARAQRRFTLAMFATAIAASLLLLLLTWPRTP